MLLSRSKCFLTDDVNCAANIVEKAKLILAIISHYHTLIALKCEVSSAIKQGLIHQISLLINRAN